MKKILLAILILGIARLCFAQGEIVYTGKAEGVAIDYSALNSKVGDNSLTAMGIKYVVVVRDKDGNVIAKIPQRIGGGSGTVDDNKQTIKNNVDKITKEIWAHSQGAIETIKSKTELENYTATCDTYIPPASR